MSGRITLGDVQRPAGSLEGWLSQRARAAPGTEEPVAAVVLGNGGLTRAVREGIGLDHLGSVEATLVRKVRPDWVGAVGGGVLLRDGRPLLVRFARLRRDSGKIWVAVWLRIAGVPMGVVPDEVWTGTVDSVPVWLKPLIPDWPAVTDDEAGDRSEPLVTDGPQTLQWRRDPGVAAPGFRIPVPAEAGFRDVVELAAGLLAARFEETGQADPTVVIWSAGELCGWWGEGARGARGAHALGRRLARDAEVQAVGMFGMGRDPDDGTALVMLVMEDRELGPVVWGRHFSRTAGQARPVWAEAAGVVRAPGPRMGWFER